MSGMDHQLGRIDLINWQGRRTRTVKPSVNLWTVLIVLCAVFGAVTMAAEAAGWLHWTGLLSLAPAALVLFAISAQLVAVARAALIWLAG